MHSGDPAGSGLAGNRDQIDAVFVDGRIRLWQGWPIDWDARSLIRDVRELATRAIAQAPIQRIHSPSFERRQRVKARYAS